MPPKQQHIGLKANILQMQLAWVGSSTGSNPHELGVGAKVDLLMLLIACCGSLVMARVFMVSLDRVLEGLNIVPACDKQLSKIV
jgi:hypothetical protein